MHDVPKAAHTSNTTFLKQQTVHYNKLYLQAFSAWIHTCAVRLFTESILRYGLPPQFLGVLMKPNAKAQAKLRKSLASVFGSTGNNLRSFTQRKAFKAFLSGQLNSPPRFDILCDLTSVQLLLISNVRLSLSTFGDWFVQHIVSSLGGH